MYLNRNLGQALTWRLIWVPRGCASRHQRYPRRYPPRLHKRLVGHALYQEAPRTVDHEVPPLKVVQRLVAGFNGDSSWRHGHARRILLEGVHSKSPIRGASVCGHVKGLVGAVVSGGVRGGAG